MKFVDFARLLIVTRARRGGGYRSALTDLVVVRETLSRAHDNGNTGHKKPVLMRWWEQTNTIAIPTPLGRFCKLDCSKTKTVPILPIVPIVPIVSVVPIVPIVPIVLIVPIVPLVPLVPIVPIWQ